jgi:hypothetical protein
MKLKAFIVVTYLFFVGSSVYGANGDLIVDGNLGVGTQSPIAKIQATGTAVVENLIQTMGYVDLAKGVAPTVTSGSLSGGGPTFRGMQTFWDVSSFPSSLTLDLSPAPAPQQIMYICFGTSWRSGNSVPKNYSIEYSMDGSSWNTLASVQNYTGEYVIQNANGISARYIRLNVLAPQDGQTDVYVTGLQVLSVQGPALYGDSPWAPRGWDAVFAMPGNVSINNGNLGIGTTTPSSKVHIISPSSNENQTAGLIVGDTSSTNLRMGTLVGSYSWIQSHGGKPLYMNSLGNNVIFNRDGGSVGIGSTAPQEKLDVNGSIRGSGYLYSTAGGASQTYLSSGGLWGNGDISLTPAQGRTLFLTNLGGASGTLDVEFLNTTFKYGNVGIGVMPSDNFEVGGNVKLLSGTTNPIRFTAFWSGFASNAPTHAEISNDTNGYKSLMIVGNSSADGSTRRVSIYDRLDVIGTAYAYNFASLSDLNFKKNIKAIDAPLDKILKMRGVSYEWKTEEFKEKNLKKGRQYGVIAQEVEQVLPEVVDSDYDGTKRVDYMALIPFLIEAIKKQQMVIDQQKQLFAGQQTELDDLKAQVEKLKKSLNP